MRKGKNRDPYLRLMDPDPDPGGPKTCGSYPQHWKNLQVIKNLVWRGMANNAHCIVCTLYAKFRYHFCAIATCATLKLLAFI
jgi:hypothetical protein